MSPSAPDSAALDAFDEAQLQRALALAQRAVGLSDPNPRVGCVLHDAQGQFAGEGHTLQAGGPHAEVMALRDAAARAVPVTGGTAWVSLEPCAHHGRTPPCCDALIAAGLRRVVVALVDPFDQVSGQGIARLRAAGMQVDVAAPQSEVARAAQDLNIGFLSRILRGRPWLRLKIAASLDGRTALADGQSQWITGLPARTDGHAWRRRANAVMTGAGTVRHDDPRLDVRLVPSVLQPLRVVVDSGLRLSRQAQILRPPGRVLVVGANADELSQMALRDSGAEVLMLPGADGRVDLNALVKRLASQGVNELHVEAGAELNGALLKAGLVDELLVYLAPRLVGPGRDMATLAPLAHLSTAQSLRFVDMRGVGDDVLIRARITGSDDFLG